MKKLALLLMLMLAGFNMSFARIVEIGDPPESVNSSGEVPLKLDYQYSACEQIYTAEQIATAGTITSIAFYYTGSKSFSAEGIQVYMRGIKEKKIPTGNIPIPISEGAKVFDGTLTVTEKGWMTITLDTPFQYNGIDNLLICLVDPTEGSITNSPSECTFKVTYPSPKTYQSLCIAHSSTPIPLSDLASANYIRGYDYYPNIRINFENETPIPEVREVGDPNTDYSTAFYPTNMSYKYSMVEQLYTAEEIGTAGKISSIAFDYNYNDPFVKEGMQVYIKHTGKYKFIDDGDFVPLSAADKVYEGTFEATGPGWASITLDTPFEYNGIDNLMVCFVDPIAGYSGNGLYNDNYKFKHTKTSFDSSVTYTNFSNPIDIFANPIVHDVRWTEFGHPNIRFAFDEVYAPSTTIVNIGDPTHGHQDNLPFNMSYQYSVGQQIYTSEEIGGSARISAIAFDYDFDTPFSVDGVQLYMKNVSDSDFGSYATPNLLPVSASDKVWEGTLQATGSGWITITLDKAFDYNETKNLLITLVDPTNDASAGNNYYFRTSHTAKCTGVCMHSEADDAPLNLSNLSSYKKSGHNEHNNIKLYTEELPEPPLDVIEIGTGGTDVSSYLPTYVYYNYSLSQQIYTKEEIGGATPLSSVSFYATGGPVTRDLEVFLIPTDKTGFDNDNDWIDLSLDNQMFSGEVTFQPNEWTPIAFSRKFNYDGTQNLALVVRDNSGSYVTSTSFLVYSSVGQTLRDYNDIYSYTDEYIASTSGAIIDKKNQIKFNEVGVDPRPYNLTASSIQHHAAQISWLGEGSRFNLQYKRLYEDEWTEVNGITAKSYTLRDLWNGTTYYVRVQIVFNNGKVSDWTKTEFTTLAYPVPTDLTIVTMTPHSAVLDWTENAGATAWKIEVNGTVTDANSKPFIITEGLKQGEENKVYVRSVIDAEKEYYSSYSTPYFFTLPEVNPAPTDLAVSNITPNSATIKWNGSSEKYQVNYGTYTNETTFYEDFEAGFDDKGWTVYTDSEVEPGKESGWYIYYTYGSNVACAASWYADSEGDHALDADNWLISPQLTFGSKLGMKIYNREDYPESFAILLSTTGKAREDFTEVLRPMSPDVHAGWQWFNFDLSAYRGQQGYIAIHQQSTDKYLLLVDDFYIQDIAIGEMTSVETTEKKVTLTGLQPETRYVCEVVGITTGSEDAKTDYEEFTTLENNPAPTDIAVVTAGTSAQISWKGYGDVYQVVYRSVGGKGSFTEGFESGTIGSDWTTYTVGEGPGWKTESGSGTSAPHDGSSCACAKSWDSGTAYDADNWLISPRLALTGWVKFWEKAADPDYADQFEVRFSYTGNRIEDFYDPVNSRVLREMAPASSTWTELTYNLQGLRKTGYVAIHHKDKDKFHLHIDDFSNYGATAIEAGEYLTKNTNKQQIIIDGLTTGTTYEFYVVSVKGSDAKQSETLEFITEVTDNQVELALDANADNSAALFTYDTRNANITINNLTFRKDGTWQGICLPFDVDLENSILRGADARVMGYDYPKDGATIVDFIETTDELEAGKPYIIRWENGEDIVNPVFLNTTVQNRCDEYGLFNFFRGSYDYKPYSIDEDVPGLYYVTGGPILTPIVPGITLHAFEPRFWFDMTSIYYCDTEYFILNTGEGLDWITGLKSIEDEKQTVIYNVAGQRLNKTQKGVNIVNGRKVMVK